MNSKAWHWAYVYNGEKMNKKLQKFFNRFMMPPYEKRVNVPFSGDAYNTKYFNALAAIRDDMYVCRKCSSRVMIFFLLLFCGTVTFQLVKMPEMLSLRFDPRANEGNFAEYIWPFRIAADIAIYLIPPVCFLHALYFFLYRGEAFNRKDLWPNNEGANRFQRVIGFPLGVLMFTFIGILGATYLPVLVFRKEDSGIFYLILVFAACLCYCGIAAFLTMLFMRLFPLSSTFRLYSKE